MIFCHRCDIPNAGAWCWACGHYIGGCERCVEVYAHIVNETVEEVEKGGSGWEWWWW